MNKLTLICITACAFSLGFTVSELRHRDAESASAYPRVQTNPTPAQIPLEASPTPRQPEPGTSRLAAAEVFSWEKIEQLISFGGTQEAITALRNYLTETPTSARAWFLLAQAYEKSSHHEAAVDAWFRYLDYEVDTLRFEQAVKGVRTYLLRLHQQPQLISGNTAWLLDQLNELLQYNTNDAELHVALASLYARLEDHYQAQYHAMMAANDPAMQQRAEDILAELNGTTLPDELSVPLVRFGNQFLVKATIEGYPARLLLDTGASLSGLADTYTARYPALVKSTKPIRLNTASGTVDSVLFTVETLHLDQLTFNQHILALLPMQNMTDFDGLLGVDILGRFDFVIDQNAAILRLRPRNK